MPPLRHVRQTRISAALKTKAKDKRRQTSRQKVMLMPNGQKLNSDPSPFPELDRAMRALVKVPKSEIDAARRKELRRKPMAGTRKRKGK